MTYTMVKKTSFRFPTERYLNIIKQGYRDCNLDKTYLKKHYCSHVKIFIKFFLKIERLL